MTAVHALRSIALARRSAAPLVRPAPPAASRPRFREALSVAGDMLGLIAIAFSLPFIILAIGTPIAVALMALLWVLRSL